MKPALTQNLEQLSHLASLAGDLMSRGLTQEALRRVAGSALTPTQLRALGLIGGHDGCSLKALAAGLDVSLPSATQLVDRLEGKRLISRQPSRADRRAVSLRLTPRGRQLATRVERERLARLRQVLGKLQAGEQETLARLLGRFLESAMTEVAARDTLCPTCAHPYFDHCAVNRPAGRCRLEEEEAVS